MQYFKMVMPTNSTLVYYIWGKIRDPVSVSAHCSNLRVALLTNIRQVCRSQHCSLCCQCCLIHHTDTFITVKAMIVKKLGIVLNTKLGHFVDKQKSFTTHRHYLVSIIQPGGHCNLSLLFSLLRYKLGCL